MKTWQIIILVAIIVLIGVGVMLFTRGDNEDTATTKGTNTQSNTKSSEPEPMQESIDIKDKTVTLSVAGYGDITVELYDEDAPKTVENFLKLTARGYYDGVTFHRVAKNFVIQGGDPTGNGTGGETADGKILMDELNPNSPSGKAGYQKGVLAMAKTQAPNSGSSQFFIILDNINLPYQYTIFGKVIAGQDIVDKIGQVEIIPQMGPTDGAPKEKIVITKATINEAK